MRTMVAGLGSRMRRVDSWITEAAKQATARELREMPLELKLAYFKELLPRVPLDDPARPVMERVIRRLESEPPDSVVFR